MLKPLAHNCTSLRAELEAVVCRSIDGCFVLRGSQHSSDLGGVSSGGGAASSAAACSTALAVSEPPLVACARHKAVAVQTTIDELDGNMTATKVQVEDMLHAVVATAHEYSSTLLAGLNATYSTRRAALETEAVAADKALENAIDVTQGLDEVFPIVSFSRFYIDLCT